MAKRGTASLLTHRWRGVDSNFRFRFPTAPRETHLLDGDNHHVARVVVPGTLMEPWAACPGSVRAARRHTKNALHYATLAATSTIIYLQNVVAARVSVILSINEKTTLQLYQGRNQSANVGDEMPICLQPELSSQARLLPFS